MALQMVLLYYFNFTICLQSPIRYDKFDSLSLHLGTTAPPLSVTGLLRAFTAPEMVKGVACSRCARQNDPALPPPLTAHIKTISIGKVNNDFFLILHPSLPCAAWKVQTPAFQTSVILISSFQRIGDLSQFLLLSTLPVTISYCRFEFKVWRVTCSKHLRICCRETVDRLFWMPNSSRMDRLVCPILRGILRNISITFFCLL